MVFRFTSIFVVMTVILASCIHKKNHVDYANEIMLSYAKEAKDKYQLDLAGFGGSMMYDIQKFDLTFHSSATPNVKEARKLFLETKNAFIMKVNSDTVIRKHLHQFPFDHSNVELDLSFFNSWRKSPSEKCVALVFVNKGTVFYEGYDPETNSFFPIHEEPYEEALKIVQNMNGESTAEQP